MESTNILRSIFKFSINGVVFDNNFFTNNYYKSIDNFSVNNINKVTNNNFQGDNFDSDVVKSKFENLKIFVNDRITLDDELVQIQDKWIKFRKRTRKTLSGDVNLRVGVWNLQSLNSDINQRYKKIEFIRDIFNENKFDIVWLIDVNDHKSIIVNGYKKYSDGRSVLLVKDEILNEFKVSMNCIYSEEMKLAFVYLTPASKDSDLMENIKVLIRNNFSVFGDLNIKSNRDFGYNNIYHFSGEDSLQIGAISKKIIRTTSIAGPSDHRFVIFNFRNIATLSHALKIGEIDYDHSKNCIWSVLNGDKPAYFPKVTKKQYRLGLNDRELSINSMIDDYLNNDVRRLFKRYNFLWKYDRREPFLGKTVPDSVKISYAAHLREDVNKIYEPIPSVNTSKKWLKFLIVQQTSSVAINHEFISLSNISKAVNEFLLDPDNKDKDIANNVIKVANEMLEDMNAEVFFLQKNKVIKDFNDVRVIVIIPTIIKIFESLIFSRVMGYLSVVIRDKNYQFGGVIGGSTYQAMMKIKKLNNKGNARGLILFDMSKGYDTVDLKILEDCLNDIKSDEVKSLCIAWVKLIKNMNVIVNDYKIKRTRGIPMGLSLSPIIFVYYVQKALADIDKSNISMYLDDLAIVFPENKSTFLCVSLVDRIIEAFAKFDLVINEKKTCFMSNDEDIIAAFSGRFKRIEAAKYLGRLVSLNGDGKIVPDDRFYNLKAFRSSACCYWATFFTKRLVFNSALDAKFRYRLLMWATNSREIRRSVWVNNWSFFRKCMGSYSYLQLCFATFNVFRYFLDICDISNWRDSINALNKVSIFKQVKDNLLVGIDKIDAAIEDIKPDFDIDDTENEFDFAKSFVDDLWWQFKKASIKNYLKEKKELKFETYENLEQFCFSKIFNSFGILQQVVFIHFRRNAKTGRAKEIFLLTALNTLLVALHKSVITSFYNLDDEAPIVNLSFQLFVDSIRYKYDECSICGLSIQDFENFMIKEFRLLWPLVDIILDVYTDSKRKGEADVPAIMQKLSNYDYVAYVDGSAKKNLIGWAGIIYDNKNPDAPIYEKRGRVEGKYARHLRNIAGELAATLKVLEHAVSQNLKKICIVFDYLGIQKYAVGAWTPHDPFIKEYVIRFKELNRLIDVEFFKIPSHTGLPGNELADTLAKKAIGMLDKKKNTVRGPLYPQGKIDYLKANYKVLFKILTVIEMIYLNNNLNNCSVDELMMNWMVKFNNLDDFTEKSYKLATLDDNLDPLDDNFVDIINDLI